MQIDKLKNQRKVNMMNQNHNVPGADNGLQTGSVDALTPGTSNNRLHCNGRCGGHESLTVRNRLFIRRLDNQSPYVVLGVVGGLVVLFFAEKAYKV